MQLMSQMSGRLSVVDEFAGALVALTARDPRFSPAAAVNNTGLQLFADLPAAHEALV